MAAFNCGIEALILGSFIMLASGFKVNWPKSANASGTRCSSVSFSGKAARIRAAREISLSSTDIPAAEEKAFNIGSNE